ncbi:hypothetical protein ACOMHN_017343 [Nucella lapillus]
METYESGSDDEVFVGEIMEREMKHPSFNSRRRTTVYFPGLTRPDANISVHRESTEEGMLLFSCENMEESGEDGSRVNKCDQMPEGLILTSESSSAETETGELSERDGSKLLNSQIGSSDGSDVDSGFSSVTSVSDGGLVYAVTSCSSLTSEESDFLQSTGARQKMTKEASLEVRKRERISSKTEPVHVQSSHQSATATADSPDLGGSAVNRGANCSEELSTGSIENAAAAQSIVNTGAALSGLALQSPRCGKSSAPAGSGIVKDFPACHSPCDSGFLSPTVMAYHRMLPLKRKIARRSPSLEVKRDLKMESRSDTSGSGIEPGKGSPVSSFSSDGDTSDYYSFNIFHASRKLQKLDLGYDKSPDRAAPTAMSTPNRKMCAGGDVQVTPRHWPAAPRILVPETPSVKPSGDVESARGNQTTPECCVQVSRCEDESDIIPPSQGTKRDASPNMGRQFSPAEPEEKNSRINSSRTEPLRPVSPNTRCEDADQSSAPLSPDLFSSPCLEKPSLAAPSSPSPGLSSRPGSASVCFSNPKPWPLQPLQPIQEEQGLRRSPKYGGLVLRKPMVTRRENKENAKDTVGLSRSSLSFVQTDASSDAEEDSQSAVTRINTMINGESRHILKDLHSSPGLLTHFPPPREATRISWSGNLAKEPVVPLSPTRLSAPPHSILQQRPDDFEFPFSKEPPSPIVLTRRRSPKFPRLVTSDS